MLLYLPLAHNFGRLMHLAGGATCGFTLAFCADPLRIGEALPQVRPTVFPSVPRVYEKVHTAVVASFDEATRRRARGSGDWALGVGREVSRAAPGRTSRSRAGSRSGTGSPTGSSTRR